MSLPTFTSKTDGVNIIYAVDVNELQNEVAPTAAASAHVRYSTTFASTATQVLTDASMPVLSDAPTAARAYTLPAVSTSNHPFYIVNRSTAYDITVSNAGAAFVGVVRASGVGIIFPNSTSNWAALSLPKYSTSTATGKYLQEDGTWTQPFADGDKGDITTSASGATWTIDVGIAKAWTGIHSWLDNSARIYNSTVSFYYSIRSSAIAANRDITLPLLTANDTFVMAAFAQTLTNKRITRRYGSTTSNATPTINTDDVDMYLITAQAADITSFTTNLSGTPTEGQTLWIAITGTAARAITWGTSFEASTVALPTTTVSTDRLDVGFVWNSVTSKWRCIAKA